MRAAPSGAVFLIAVELFESKAVSLFLASIFGNLARSYMFGATSGWGKVQSAARQHGINIGTFSLLRDLDISDRKAVVALPDLKALEKQLREFGPDSLKKFRKDARRVGTPARDALRSVYRSVGTAGPLGGPRRPGRRYDKMATSYNGRLSYMTSYIRNYSSKGIDVNYKNRTEGKALSQLQTAKDGTISIVRLIVRAPAFIVADMAGKSHKARKNTGDMSREYQINLFNKGVVTRRHRINIYNTENWIDALNKRAHNRRQNKPSRYAWPTMEKYMSKHKLNVAQLLNEVIATTNKKLAE